MITQKSHLAKAKTYLVYKACASKHAAHPLIDAHWRVTIPACLPRVGASRALLSSGGCELHSLKKYVAGLAAERNITIRLVDSLPSGVCGSGINHERYWYRSAVLTKSCHKPFVGEKSVAIIGKGRGRELHRVMAKLKIGNHYAFAALVVARPVSSLAALTPAEADAVWRALCMVYPHVLQMGVAA